MKIMMYEWRKECMCQFAKDTWYREQSASVLYPVKEMNNFLVFNIYLGGGWMKYKIPSTISLHFTLLSYCLSILIEKRFSFKIEIHGVVWIRLMERWAIFYPIFSAIRSAVDKNGAFVRRLMINLPE